MSNECVSCELIGRRDRGLAPDWDDIVRTPGWDVAHAFDTPVEGWTVLVVRRHITRLSQLADDEAAELGPLVTRVSAALETVTGCEKTYVAQFAEHPSHPHVHVHVIPRAPDLDPGFLGPRIFGLPGEVEDQVRSRLVGDLRPLLADLARPTD